MIDRHMVPTSWGHVHLATTKGEGVPLVALHMSPLSSRMWEPLMARLARPVVAPDRLGFGCSDPPPRALTMVEYARATIEALDGLGVGRFDLLGEHTGSVEAVALADLIPGRVRRIGLVAVPAYTDAELEERRVHRAVPPPEPRDDGSHLVEIWQKRLAFRKPPYDLDQMHRITIDELRSAGSHLAYRAVFDYPMLERLSALDRPLVVFAPHDDLADQTERARDRLPQGSVFIDLPELSMDIFEVAADRMAALVTEHLGEG